MKNRVMSGCVTVTGPPRAICSLNFGITLPLEPSTLPKRTAENTVPDPCVARCDSTRSAARLLAPITFVGLTALSVLIITNRSTPHSFAASAVWYVPSVLFCSAAQAFSSSINGTCLNAAAWKTSWGRYALNVERRCARSFTSPINRSSGKPGCSSPSCCSIWYSANSLSSYSTMRAGP